MGSDIIMSCGFLTEFLKTVVHSKTCDVCHVLIFGLECNMNSESTKKKKKVIEIIIEKNKKILLFLKAIVLEIFNVLF